MKLYNRPDKKGFTLVELLVVISIIAILSVVGVSVFSGMQTRARDARRQTDINAISDALENNYSESLGSYTSFADSWMASGTRPSDPSGNAYSGYPTANAANYTVCASMQNVANGNTLGGTSFCLRNQR